MPTPTAVAQRLYDAMAHADGIALFGLLTEDFVGTVSTGMPHGVGGEHHGAADMITEVWAGSRPFTRCMSSHTTTYTLTTSGWWCSAGTGARPATAVRPWTPSSPTSSPRAVPDRSVATGHRHRQVGHRADVLTRDRTNTASGRRTDRVGADEPTKSACADRSVRGLNAHVRARQRCCGRP